MDAKAATRIVLRKFLVQPGNDLGKTLFDIMTPSWLKISIQLTTGYFAE